MWPPGGRGAAAVRADGPFVESGRWLEPICETALALASRAVVVHWVCCALRLHRLRAIYLNFHFFDNFLDTAIAAKRPGEPMKPPPGCAPDPHIYNPLMGVLGETHFSATGLVRNNWSRDMDP